MVWVFCPEGIQQHPPLFGYFFPIAVLQFHSSTENKLTSRRLEILLARLSQASPAPTHDCPASIRTRNGPLQGPVHVGVRFKAQVHHHGDGPGLLGAAIYRAVSWT